MDAPIHARLELRICRRKRTDRPDKPGCHFNLSEQEFTDWEVDLQETYPGITIIYSERSCLGLCPKKGISTQIGLQPVVVNHLDEIKGHINAYIKKGEHEKNNP